MSIHWKGGYVCRVYNEKMVHIRKRLHTEETTHGRNYIRKRLGIKGAHTEGITYDEEYTGSGRKTRTGLRV